MSEGGNSMKTKTNEQNGTTRRGVLAGLLSLPVVALTAASTSIGRTRATLAHTQADVVRQSELQTVIDYTIGPKCWPPLSGTGCLGCRAGDIPNYPANLCPI
jgi:hypothetical protein